MVYDDAIATTEIRCVVYGLTGAYNSFTQVQSCTKCPSARRRLIGPDCREIGLFNYNNKMLFTHELLDDYTSAYTTSETPFTAWVAVLSRRYASRRSPHAFVSEDIYRTIWFAYVNLQSFENDMQCPTCGPSPETVIWDGVTVAFSRKNIQSSLQPPTVCHGDSITRASRYQSQLQAIPMSQLRKRLKKVVNGRSLVLQSHERMAVSNANVHLDTLASQDGSEEEEEEEDEEEEEEGCEGDVTSTGTALDPKTASQLMARVKAVPQVVEDLTELNQHLGDMFKQHFGLEAILRHHEAPAVYRAFFIQVCLQWLHS